MKQAALILEDGSIYTGWSFGYDGDAAGEVVFNTAMTGYTESLTDPSYAGQVLVMTSPSVGSSPCQMTSSTVIFVPTLSSERLNTPQVNSMF